MIFLKIEDKINDNKLPKIIKNYKNLLEHTQNIKTLVKKHYNKPHPSV
jgi:hypothetical protein